MKLSLIPVIIALSLTASQDPPFDLIIRNATLFDVKAKSLRPRQAIAITGGRIEKVLDTRSSTGMVGRSEIDAKGRVVTPGFIDVHFHLDVLLADSVTPGGGGITHLSMTRDSIESYRARFADVYLPYGVTVVREAGTAEKNLPLLLEWMKSTPASPDFFPVGGAIVSHEEGRTPYEGHVVVRDALDAVRKVEEYFNLGLRHVKLYWRLRQREFDAAARKAQELGMNVCAHVDFNILSVEHAITVGVRDLEHAYTLWMDVLTRAELDSVDADRRRRYAGRTKALFFTYVTDAYRAIGNDNPRMVHLIRKIRRSDASLTPTLHVFAHPLGLSYFELRPRGTFDDVSDLSKVELDGARRGYRILASYVKRMFDEGIPLNIGSDSPEPGKSVLSEMLLLNEAGIPMSDVLVMATVNGARAIGKEDIYGSIEVGKQANLIIFEKSPLDNRNNLLGSKVVIKDGVVYSRGKQ